MALLAGRPPNSKPPAPADAANVMKSLRVYRMLPPLLVLGEFRAYYEPTPYIHCLGGAKHTFLSSVLAKIVRSAPCTCEHLRTRLPHIRMNRTTRRTEN